MSSPAIKEIVRGIRFDLDNAPAVLQVFDDDRLPDIRVADGYKGSRESYAKMLISLGTGYLVEALSNHFLELQLKYGIHFDILRLQRRILTYDCLAAISYYWLSENTVELPGVYKWQKRMAFRLIAFFHNLRVTSPREFNDAFDAVFGLLVDQLAGRDDYKDFGIGVDVDQTWLAELEDRKRKRPQTVCNEKEQSREPAEPCSKKVKPDSDAASASQSPEDDAAALARAEEQALIDSWIRVRRRRSVKNLTLETVRKPPTNGFNTQSASSARLLSASPAHFGAQASLALVDKGCADKTC
ncbi:hypothetical protein K525DRAFT_291570 [Schizophyllum commune Loenen D]|nr:hypothetical protein K525DRAFT_291570 [Schizophyllum commune Loenen D]